MAWGKGSDLEHISRQIQLQIILVWVESLGEHFT